MFDLYFQKLKELFNKVTSDQKKNILDAATIIAECIEKDGIVHVFGSGHSHMIGEELFYRAGGLAAINPILIEDLMLHKGAVRSSQLEKTNGYAANILEKINILPKDVVIVVSTSGRNPVPIDVAGIAKKRGAVVITISSFLYTESVTSRHQNGIFLSEVSDIKINNHISVGDTLMSLESLNVSFGSGSTVIGTAIVNGIMAESIEIMVRNNFNPPIFKSGNADGAEEHNKKLIEKYKDRIPLLNS